jgi:aminoglycoside 6'-N-acetyltransferase I
MGPISMNAIIKRVCADHKDLFAKVAKDVFDAPIQADRLDAYLALPGHIMYVAIIDDMIIGQVRAIIHKHPDGPADLYVDNLGVTPEHQREGVATELMNEIIRHGWADGCEAMWVATETENDDAVGFYRSMALTAEDVVMFSATLKAQ